MRKVLLLLVLWAPIAAAFGSITVPTAAPTDAPTAAPIDAPTVDICAGISDYESVFGDLQQVFGFDSCASFKDAGFCNADVPLGVFGTYYCVETCGTTFSLPGSEQTCNDRAFDNNNFVAFLGQFFEAPGLLSCATHLGRGDSNTGQPVEEICDYSFFAYVCPVSCQPALYYN
ncbi:hypothetical protein M885DRAFT_560703 [Pelagophyceae sp. CCMP2097]|nr:hypothetical protein M885DRAFT_560703 [Pelagophyceae sp. CCMP2097]